jgi:acyl-CoA synthetase (AMP-forming)/AMP-acid ligase II
VPHERWGETPKALVVLEGGQFVAESELIARTRETLGSIKKVTSVEFVAALPRSAAGKVLRSVAREPYWAGVRSRVGGA